MYAGLQRKGPHMRTRRLPEGLVAHKTGQGSTLSCFGMRKNYENGYHQDE